MLNKENIIKIIKNMNFPSNDYWITSGAGLVLHGVKEFTGDIDLGCSTSLVEYYIETGCSYRLSHDHVRIVEINDQIELLENWYVDEIELIHELPVASLESIKKQKAELGREKNWKDIKLIEEYISKEESKK